MRWFHVYAPNPPDKSASGQFRLVAEVACVDKEEAETLASIIAGSGWCYKVEDAGFIEVQDSGVLYRNSDHSGKHER